MLEWLRRDHEIYCSDFGREYGWFVEWQGQRVAELVDPVWDVDSQFWHAYRMIPLAQDPQQLAAVNSHEFWFGGGRLIYENRKYGTRVGHVLAGLLSQEENGAKIVYIRGLSVPVWLPLLWEVICAMSPQYKKRYATRMEASAKLYRAKRGMSQGSCS